MFTNFLPCSHAINPNNEICLVTCATWLMCVHFFLPPLLNQDTSMYICTSHIMTTCPIPVGCTCHLPCIQRPLHLLQCSLHVVFPAHTDNLSCPNVVYSLLYLLLITLTQYNIPCIQRTLVLIGYGIYSINLAYKDLHKTLICYSNQLNL